MRNCPANLRPSTYYHKGWAEAEAGKNSDAVISLGEYIKGSPTDAEIPKALAKRGLSYKTANDGEKALADFQRIIKDYPKDEAVELAYYLSAVIHADQKKTKLMIEDFDSLLKLFPTSPARAEAYYRSGVGYMSLKETSKALPLLRKAVEADKKAYGKLGSEQIQLCLWDTNEPDALASELDSYRTAYRDTVMPPNMLNYLGLTFFNRKDYPKAVRYLTLGSTPDAPENTDPTFWNYLAQSLLEVKKYDESVVAIEHVLSASPDPRTKALAELTKRQRLARCWKI